MYLVIILFVIGYAVWFSGLSIIRNPGSGLNPLQSLGFNSGQLAIHPDREDVLTSLVTVNAPPNSKNVSTSGSSGSYVTNSQIATDALQYQGIKYSWGKASPSTGWDCSGFVNWVLGHDLGMTLPGGVKGFTGKTHGPVTGQYYVWSGARTIPRSQCQAGDLCCFPNHIGIAVSNSQMINAYVVGKPTGITPINNWAPGPLLIRRVKQTVQTPVMTSASIGSSNSANYTASPTGSYGRGA